MKMKLGACLAPVAAILLVFLLACTATAPANTPADTGANGAGDAPTPDNGDAVADDSLTVAVDRETLEAFAASQQAINMNWDQFHTEFDLWRTNLTSCDRGAAWTAFRDFAGDFSAITEEASDLPGSSITRELTYGAIDAAALEASALRRLRDNWQPGDVALLETVHAERNTAALQLRETADRLDELQDLDRPEERAAAEEFAEAFKPIDTEWDDFHSSYNELRRAQDDLPPEAVIDRLKTLVEYFELIIDLLQELPDDAATDEVAEDLVEAARDELNELDELLDAFQSLDKQKTALEEAKALERAEAKANTGAEPEPPKPEPTLQPPEPPEPPKPEPTPLPNATSTPPLLSPEDNSDLFRGMDQQLEDSNQARKEARRTLETLIEGVSVEDLDALAAFATAFAQLRQNWAAFHRDYDAWGSDEGGCDRAAAAEALGRFDQIFSGLGARVRGLSQAPYLRPSSDLLAEAIEGEAAALRSLRSTWRPFDPDVYRELEQARADADNLRRLAGRRTQEALERFGAAP